MLVTFTNIDPDNEARFVAQVYKTLQAGESVTAERRLEDLAGDVGLQKLVNAGYIRLSYEKSPDDITGAAASLPTYTNSTRPDPTTLSPGFMIFNPDDGTPNVCDGTNWRDMAGNLT